MKKDMIAVADSLAACFHADQKDKAGNRYIKHPRGVANLFVRIAQSTLTPEEITIGHQAALLHDVIEDTACTYHGLRDAGFSPEVVLVVSLMTRTPANKADGSYVRNLAAHRIGRLVKIADLLHNSMPSRVTLLDEADRVRLRPEYDATAKALGFISPTLWWELDESGDRCNSPHPDSPAGRAEYVMVYRCQGENVLGSPCGWSTENGSPCGWSTENYGEIDAHENQGFDCLVIGEMERVIR